MDVDDCGDGDMAFEFDNHAIFLPKKELAAALVDAACFERPEEAGIQTRDVLRHFTGPRLVDEDC